ncbi:MAG: hypothetical protein ACKVVP_01670 [Chloroflexota bacterium]
MALIGEWRTGERGDAVLIVNNERHEVREAFVATPGILSRLLTTPGDFDAWRSDLKVPDDRRNPASWGSLVLARANTGEVITMDPARFWEGVYEWFRSRGVDYDTPGQ